MFRKAGEEANCQNNQFFNLILEKNFFSIKERKITFFFYLFTKIFLKLNVSKENNKKNRDFLLLNIIEKATAIFILFFKVFSPTSPSKTIKKDFKNKRKYQ